ncbi:MAG: hypothetical protein JWN93_303 [Hyphomicrobiales bacterium]|nr:hypothetical protein [Hyphomicrobiales bacterium]
MDKGKPRGADGPMSLICVAGEAILDLVPDAAGAYEPALGGSGFNTARALGRLGARTSFLGALSRDAFGARFAASLEQAGVDLSGVVRTDAPSALALVSGETQAGPGFSLYLAGTAHEAALPPRELPAGAAHLHCASFHAVMGESGARMLDLMGRWRGRATISFDPNVRPGVLGPREAAVALVEARVALSDIVKASEQDMGWLYPGVDPQESMRRWSDGGARLAVLTRGPLGALAFRGDARAQVFAPGVAVVDTVGAGDVFTAGLLASLAQAGALGPGARAPSPGALEAALAFAASAASFACARRGAEGPTRAELVRHG